MEERLAATAERKRDEGLTDERAVKLERFFRALTVAKAQPLLLLDYDGTLAAFRVDRFQSRPWAGVRELLKAIQDQGKTRMAVITGRPACEIAPMLGLEPPLEVWGLHGAERLYPDGRRELETAPGASREKLDAMRAQLKTDSLGGLYEDKDNAAVMHWRGYSAEKAQEIRRRALELFGPLAGLPGLRLLDFDGGVELRAGRDKGGAIGAIMAEGVADAPVAYLGDDLSDEAAFDAVNRARGPHVSVLVRRKWRETAAEVWIKPPAELRGFLERWRQAL
ncbi:MAG: trehalose-phosphatase [Terracidiphilus sp.]|nr:trehalose-phosphatase [Terracidiphilus sp.]